MRTARPARLCFAASVLVAGLSAAPALGQEILAGPTDFIAIDQPRVTFGLTDETAGTLVGPTLPGQALLDTVANGVLLGQLSYIDGEDYGFLGQYSEIGVAGPSLFDVHAPWGLRINDSNGDQFLVRQDVQALGDSSLSLGSFNAVLGMPAMAGYEIEIDMTPLSSTPIPEFIRTVFHDPSAATLVQSGPLQSTAPGMSPFSSAAFKTVDLRIIPPSYTDTSLPPEDRPTFFGLPAVDNISMRHAGGSAGGGGTVNSTGISLVMDTGAQNSIFSQSVAASLGINFTDLQEDGGDVLYFLEVGGVGGTVFMPIVEIDRMAIPTSDGMQIVFTELQVGILDIQTATFDGVIGNNVLTTGYGGILGAGADPVFDKVVFDFTPNDGTASMRLDFTNALELINLGDFDHDGDVDNADAAVLIGGFGTTSGATYAQGDIDGDGDVDNADAAVFIGNFGTPSALTASDGDLQNVLARLASVPEPGTLVLIATAGALTAGRRRRTER